MFYRVCGLVVVSGLCGLFLVDLVGVLEICRGCLWWLVRFGCFGAGLGD